MAEPITLDEHGSPTEVELSRTDAETLAATGVVTVSPTAGAGDRWLISAGSKVGTLVVGEHRILIRPKIHPDNLFLLLEVGLPPSAWRSESFDYSVTGDLLPSLIAFFTRTVETTLARGLVRSYREERESLVAMRGRPDLAIQISRGGLAFPIACRYEDYTADNAENRYLKAAVRRAGRVPGPEPIDRRRLLQQLVALEDVSDAPAVPDDLDDIGITRLNAHYEPALRLAQLVLANLTLQDQAGVTSASSFIVDMNLLFERFVTERLRRALLGRLQVRKQTNVHLAEGRRVLMHPDLEFRNRRGETVFVGDVKYKLTSDARARNADLYQLLAYTTALDLHEGVLIYCLADDGTPQRTVTVRHAGKILHTYAVDLSGSADSVAEQLGKLADWIANRSKAIAPLLSSGFSGG